jgi:hypothetical protein
MKSIKTTVSLIALLLCFSLASRAQEQVAIPLSNPDQPGTLDLGVVRGSITVTGYDGKEVIIRYGNGEREDDKKAVTQNGMRRISSGGIGFEATEDNNHVEIGGVSPMQDASFHISVPRRFSLNLSTVNGGEIRVENVTGEMELSNVNGEITLINVGGSAVANTVNGDITATFNSVTSGKPMAFSNLNGDIDVTFPANAAFTAKMKSEWGEIFTDFNMTINRTEQDRVSTSADSGTYKVTVNNWISGSINGGGPEYLFKSMRGDIYIRKN